MTLPLIAALVAVLACLLVGRSAHLLLRNMRPAQAVVVLALVSVTVSLASGMALTAIAVAVIASLTAVASDGHWSASIIRTEVPIPGWLGALAALAVVVLMARGAVRTVSIVMALVRADRLCRDIRADGGPVVVVDDESADAYTVAGIRGCVVISQRLLTRLTADERRVLTAHELSHLTKRHHLYVHLADIAAAGNPLLAPVSAAVRLGVERWADEDAATGIGDRRVTGRALARVALLRSEMSRAIAVPTVGPLLVRVPVLGVGALLVASRVQALLQPKPRPYPGRAAAFLLLSVLVLLVGVASLNHIHDAIEGAAPYLRHGH
ncbi:Peptidase family M48 [Nakamurella panacisegetis]|uniref:Peptidase family M48 n=1 Tax=Nakamurella panacisegetis TaxID=1090615 RepID=A0A1H0QR03_9ACTN|nr:M56 family metallopeptidase [Nakamurella panacisegetis]SDP19712.1 Peptidase family M48 [Nakamurella panacisegetis]